MTHLKNVHKIWGYLQQILCSEYHIIVYYLFTLERTFKDIKISMNSNKKQIQLNGVEM